MNNYIKKKIRRFLILIVCMIGVLSILVYKIPDKTQINTVNLCRIVTHDNIQKIEQAVRNNNFDNIDIDDMNYSVISLNGTIIKTTEENKNIGDKVNLKTDLSFDNSFEVNNPNNIRYSTLLTIDDNVTNIVTLIIPTDLISKMQKPTDNSYYVFGSILVFFVLMYCIFKVYRLVIGDIFNPIKEMHKSAKSILKGSYEEKVYYDYDGEIGEFAHDFENMRDTLKNSKEEEERMKNSEKELLACISHDLKTPISSISGYCEGILDGVVKSEGDIKRYCGIILKKAKVLTKLIDDILEYSKAEINKMSINKEEVYSREFLLEILEDLSIDVESKKRNFVLEGNIPNVLLKVDKKRIEEVFYNIVGNSIKYTNEDGVIRIKVTKEDTYLYVSIKDNGIGIGDSDIPLVFNKFYRGEKHRNMNIPGSGLGLSISKYIIEQHDGNIQINSNQGLGTEVMFSIKI